MLIGLTGQKRSGKDTFAYIVESLIPNVKKISFAHPMKEIAKIMFNLNDQELEEQKETFELDGITPRKFLQLFGTEFCRKLFKDDIWVRKAFDSFDPKIHTIITDVRFDNEAEYIKNLGGLIVKVVRGEEKVAEHCSEAGVSEQFIDKIILNNGLKSDYENKALDLYMDLLMKEKRENILKELL